MAKRSRPKSRRDLTPSLVFHVTHHTKTGRRDDEFIQARNEEEMKEKLSLLHEGHNIYVDDYKARVLWM